MRAHNRDYWLVFLAIFMAFNVYGAEKKLREPLTIEADRAVIDEKKGLSVYSGNVVLIQGPNTFRADILTVYGSKENKIDKILAEGKPIHFRQKGVADQSDISGEALKFQFFATEKRLLLLGEAKLKQGNNFFSGDKIEYDTQRQIVTAEASKSSKERVKVTINPDNLVDAKPEPAQGLEQEPEQEQEPKP